jgi:hypothetical protein
MWAGKSASAFRYGPATLKVAGLTALLLPLVLWAGHQTPLLGISLTNNQGLSFGKFAAASTGTVTVSPAGVRSATGGVILLSSESGAAAQFTVSGESSLTYDIFLPADGVVSLSSSGGQTLPVRAFTSSPSGSGQLGIGGSQTLNVGATLDVGAGQTPGAYTGSFDVTVNYN